MKTLCIHGSPMKVPMKVGSTMEVPTEAWCSILPMDVPWKHHGNIDVHMEAPGSTAGVPSKHHRSTTELPMEALLCFHGSVMRVLWRHHGSTMEVSMEALCFYASPIEAPMESPCFRSPYGSTMEAP